jgi:membrane-anchored protein YejM (alkaline phosphatase superfamily)
LYGCAVEYLDRRVCQFIDQLQAGTDDDTTADHGEELGRETERTLGHKIPSAAITHVPLEIINPPPSWESRQMTELVSLLDLDQIISGILDDNEPTITREIAPAERLGDTSPPKEQKSF